MCTYSTLKAQFSDDFGDGDHTANPAWIGNTDKYEIDGAQKLHLNAPAETSFAYISTSSNAIGESEWLWHTEISENPSSTNYLKTYLVSDQHELDGSLNGYFVKIGGTNDEVSLFRQDGLNETLIIDGLDDRVNTKPVKIQVRVTRDLEGNWSLQVKPDGSSTFVEEGSAFDDTHTQSSFFGFYCKYTSTRSNAFYFDDVIVDGGPIPDQEAPVLKNQLTSSASEVKLIFSEPLEPATALAKSNYQLNGNEVEAIAYENDTVKLTFISDFPNAVKQQLNIKNIEDVHQNAIADTLIEIFYFEKVKASWESLVINEIFPDPTPSLGEFPDESDAEFIEIYNPGPHPYDLLGWNLNDKILPNFILHANEYVILCKPEYRDAYEQYGNVISLSSWPTLSNSGGSILLQDDAMDIIDSISYTSTVLEEGTSLERIYITSPCGGQANVAVSQYVNGATPGEKNSIFSDKTDIIGPVLIHVKAINEDSLLLSFDEKVYLNEPYTSRINVDNNIFPLHIDYVSEDSTQLLLVFENELGSDQFHTIYIPDAYDCNGNNSKIEKSFYLDLHVPEVERIIVIDTTEILVQFSEKLLKENAEKDSNFRILSLDEHPKKAVLSEDSLSVHLSFSSNFDLHDTLILSIVLIEDIYQNQILSASPEVAPFVYVSEILKLSIINAYQIDVLFENVPTESSATETLNYFIDREIGNPSKVVRNKDNPGLFHLILKNSLSPNKAHTLSINNLYSSSDKLLSTPNEHFFYDTKGPALTQVRITDAHQIAVHFDEMIDTVSLKNLIVLINGDTANYSNVFWYEDQLHLTLVNALEQEKNHQIAFDGLLDLQSNSSDPKKSFDFLLDQLPPKLDSAYVYSPKQLMLVFHEPLLIEDYPPEYFLEMLKPADEAKEVKFYQLSPKKVLFTFDVPLIVEDINIRIKNFSDIQTNQMETEVEHSIKHNPPEVGHLVLLSNQHILLSFTSDISALNLKSGNFTVNNGYVPEAVKKISNCELELEFAEAFYEFTDYSLNFKHEGKQQKISFSFQDHVESVSLNGASTVTISFDIPLESSNAENSKNYSLNSLVQPLAAVYLSEIQSVQLLFDSTIDPTSLQTITLKHLRDIDHNIIPQSEHLFGKINSPKFQQLLITEVMAAPSSTSSLPDAEYVEIYNASDSPLQLKDVQLADPQKKSGLGDKWIAPGEYLILCNNNKVSAMSDFGNCLGVIGFPNLNDNTDTLRLLSTEGDVIHEMAYHKDWYNDTYKNQGGWSLEMIDTDFPCQQESNWTASVDPKGGTPGSKNSVQQSNPDLQAPHLLKAVADDSVTVILTYNEILSMAEYHPSNFQIENIRVNHIAILPNLHQIKLTLDNALEAGTEYTLSIKFVSDCSGNVQQKETAKVILADVHQRNDILISEILFHPRSGGVDFVELFNKSEKHLNLKNWSLATSKDDQVVNKSLISDESLVIAPGNYLAITEDTKILKGDYPHSKNEHLWKSHTFPPLLVDGGTLLLLDEHDSIMQKIQFSPDMHHPLIQESKGVSLERISWNDNENNPEYWQSAASTVGYATPGFQNSQRFHNTFSQKSLSIIPPIFYPDQSGHSDYTTINFNIEKAGSIGNLKIFDTSGKLVRQLVSNYSLGESGFVTWDGTDDNKKRVKTGYYIVWMEVFNTEGVVQILKSKVVVGTKY
ncbi:lamin tail domain-containing protein [Catalinimonas alkaloidigena]|uniref:lamin tail domain-containing protein n=1 Tax=Catalinimonas alkaloidigena TaxID=1075417 RepID=UPI002405DEDA|nr:lamin tail domain-containing protein [Catalinimonas alkaloidigena]